MFEKINFAELEFEKCKFNCPSTVAFGSWKRGNSVKRPIAIKLIADFVDRCGNGYDYVELKSILEREVEILFEAHRKHVTGIVEVLGIIEGVLPPHLAKWPLEPESKVYGVVYPYYPSTLESLFTDSALSSIDYSTKLHYLIETSKSLADLHVHQIVHGDMKPSNILLDDHRPPLVRVCDFGLSTILEDLGMEQLHQQNTLKSTINFRGTAVYAAPGKFDFLFFFLFFIVHSFDDQKC
jgi:serine/threonine protein kinase